MAVVADGHVVDFENTSIPVSVQCSTSDHPASEACSVVRSSNSTTFQQVQDDDYRSELWALLSRLRSLQQPQGIEHQVHAQPSAVTLPARDMWQSQQQQQQQQQQ